MKFVTKQFCLLVGVMMTLLGTAQTPCSGTPGANSITPLSQTICAGNSINLGLANSYTNSGYTFQWQNSTTSIVGPYTSISGATLHTLATPGLTTTMFYNVIITCTNSGLSISVPYSVTVIPCNVPCSGAPASTSILPLTATVCSGSNALLSLSSTYTDTGISYQWYASPVAGGTYSAIPGASLSTFVSPTITTTGNYQVVITCANSSLTYTAAQTVSAVPCSFCSGAPGTNSAIALSPTLCAGNSTTLSLALDYAVSGYTYQWQQSTISQVGPFQNIAGATSSVFVTPVLSGNVYYNLVVTCTNSGQSISLPVSVTVVNCNTPCNGTPPANTLNPSTASICAGSSTILALVNPYFQTGYAFQWASASSASGPFTTISGATQSIYTTPLLSNNTFYQVVVTCTNSALSASVTASLVVQPCVGCSGAPAANTVVPVNSTVCIGSSTTLSLATTYSTAGFTYQWSSSSVSSVGPFTAIAGATNAVYATPGLSLNTFYSLVITCTASGQSIQIPAAVFVTTCATQCSGPPAATSISLSQATICSGASVTMSSTTVYTVPGISYQWYDASALAGPFNSIIGATGPVYNSPALTANTYYRLVVTCANGSQSVSASQSVAVVPCITPCSGAPASNTIAPVSHTICFPNSATMSLVYTYTESGISYQWESSTLTAGPYTLVPGATSFSFVSGVLWPTTYFNAIITCSNSGLSTRVSHTVQVFDCAATIGLAETAAGRSLLKVIPNPTSGNVVIEFSQQGEKTISISDISGRLLQQQSTNDSMMQMDLQFLQNGIYSLCIEQNGLKQVIKLYKE